MVGAGGTPSASRESLISKVCLFACFKNGRLKCIIKDRGRILVRRELF